MLFVYEPRFNNSWLGIICQKEQLEKQQQLQTWGWALFCLFVLEIPNSIIELATSICLSRNSLVEGSSTSSFFFKYFWSQKKVIDELLNTCHVCIPILLENEVAPKQLDSSVIKCTFTRLFLNPSLKRKHSVRHDQN